MFFNRFTIVVWRITPPGEVIADPADRYTGRWYVQEADFDAGNRVVAQSTGAQTLNLTDTSQESKVFISYTDRGTVKQVTSSFGILVDHVYRDADGLVTQIEYGDVAKTTTDFTYAHNSSGGAQSLPFSHNSYAVMLWHDNSSQYL